MVGAGWGGGGWGVARGAAAPLKFWVTQSCLTAREIWAKPIFKEVSMFFYYYFGEINIFYFILKSAW